MKKRFVLISLLIIFLSITLIALFANVESTSQDDKVNSAYAWLKSQDATSTEDISFKLLAFFYNDSIASGLRTSLLARNTTIDAENINWDNSLTNTAYAIIALKAIEYDTTKAENWIYSKKSPAEADMEWYLQIDPQNAEVNCTIDYVTSNATLVVKQDRKYTSLSDQGSCFSVVNNNYWLKMTGSCTSNPITVSCNQTSTISLLFKKSTDTFNTVTVQSTGAKKTPAELRAEAYCLKTGSSCDYAGTLWAAYALSLSEGKESRVNEVLPYLTSNTDSSVTKTIRDALLFLITSTDDYKTSLLKNQSSAGWWPKETVGTPTSNNYWDTAVAVHALARTQRTLANITKVTSNFNVTLWTSDNNWGLKQTGMILYSLFPQRYTTSCERAKMTYPGEDFRCSNTSNMDYIINLTYSCASIAGNVPVDLGDCYQKSPCKKILGSSGLCNISMGPNFYRVDSAKLNCGELGCCGTDANSVIATCWNVSACYNAQAERGCASSCNTKTEIQISSLNDSCGTNNACCLKTDCAKANGTCMASSDDIGMWENKALTPSCTTGLRCFQKSPCEKKNGTCAEDSCPSGSNQIKSTNKDKYACNQDVKSAVCCQVANPPDCTFSCNNECLSPFTQILNFKCTDPAKPDCCRIIDTCSVNKGYSCKLQCGNNEIEATDLNCPDGSGVCCKPTYQCLAANDTCRSGTICSTGEKNVSYSCPENNVCCEKVPSNTCENIYGYKCKTSCSTTETQLSYSCLSGVCCAVSTNVTCLTLYDCANKPECNNQIVQDFYFRPVKCEYGKELSCSDGYDNDGDGFVDGQDPDCPTCLNKQYSCCAECEPGHSQSSLDSSCSPDVCCDQCKQVTATCSSEGYSCCDECETGTEKSGFDGSCSGQVCCSSCKAKKSNVLLYVVLAVLILGIAGAAYYLLVMKKKKKPGPGQGFPEGMGFRPAVRPYMPPAQQKPSSYMPNPPSSQQIQLRQPSERPKPTKTETELEETLNKLKRMSNK
jgi:hypothetical protein